MRSLVCEPLVHLRLGFRKPPIHGGESLLPLGIGLGKAPLEPDLDLSTALLELGVGLRKTLLRLGVETRKVQLVQLPEFSLVRRVHGIEQVYELVDCLLAQALVEMLGLPGCDGHGVSMWVDADTLDNTLGGPSSKGLSTHQIAATWVVYASAVVSANAE